MRFASRQNPKLLLWPLSGLLLCGLVACNPFYAPRIGIPLALACFAVSLTLTLWLCHSSIGVRIAVLLGGLMMCVPCFVWARPLERGLLTCLMALPYTFAAMLMPHPAMPTLRERVAFLSLQLSDGGVIHRPRRFDFRTCLQMLLGTAIFTLAMMTIKTLPAHGGWLVLRWLAGGIMLLAVGELITGSNAFWAAVTGVSCPRLFHSPWLATSVGEFWAARWNLPTSRVFYRNCFVFLAPGNVWVATTVVFFASGIVHMALAYVATFDRNLSICFGLFFIVQPVLFAAERALAIRHRPKSIARIWTLGALGITCPLLIEPLIQIADPNWGGPDVWFMPTLWLFSSVFLFCGILALATAISKGKDER